MEKCIYECFALRGAKEALFQSNKSRQINPNMSRQIQTASVTTRFKRINSDRLIPIIDVIIDDKTQFVFQSYQSKQINPDPVLDALRDKKLGKFQSYQSRQINPDWVEVTFSAMSRNSFNRINPNRSIPTWSFPNGFATLKWAFQSYQFRQINTYF